LKEPKALKNLNSAFVWIGSYGEPYALIGHVRFWEERHLRG
jgi:hypothetical protein